MHFPMCLNGKAWTLHFMYFSNIININWKLLPYLLNIRNERSRVAFPWLVLFFLTRPHNSCEKRRKHNLQISSLIKVCAISSFQILYFLLSMSIDAGKFVLIDQYFAIFCVIWMIIGKWKLEHIVQFILRRQWSKTACDRYLCFCKWFGVRNSYGQIKIVCTIISHHDNICIV